MWIFFVALAIVFALAALLAQALVERQSAHGKAFRLLRTMIAREQTEAERANQADRLLFGQWLRSRLPGLDQRFLRPLLEHAGYYAERNADLAVLVWLALLVGTVLLSTLLPGPAPLWGFAAFTITVLGPYLYLRRRASRLRATIAKGLPDVLDLLVVCVEAGLGLDQSVLRVSEELADTHPEMRIELERLMQHQRAGMPRLEAWQRMAERLGIPEVDAFVTMILQTERFGTPIARALSEFAALSRQKRTQSAEEQAAKTTVKISFPLILFIFPCIFIVLLGPALLNMMRSFASFLH